MVTEDGAASNIAVESHHLGKNRAVQKHRVAAKPMVGWNHDLRLRATMLRHQSVECRGPDKRLIRENDERAGACCAHSGKSHLQRSSHAAAIISVENYSNLLKINFPLDLLRSETQNQNDFAHS